MKSEYTVLFQLEWTNNNHVDQLPTQLEVDQKPKHVKAIEQMPLTVTDFSHWAPHQEPSLSSVWVFQLLSFLQENLVQQS